jgi:hypothetical protein
MENRKIKSSYSRPVCGVKNRIFVLGGLPGHLTTGIKVARSLQILTYLNQLYRAGQGILHR